MWVWIGAALTVWLTYVFYKAAAADRDAGRIWQAWGNGVLTAAFSIQAVVLLELLLTR